MAFKVLLARGQLLVCAASFGLFVCIVSLCLDTSEKLQSLFCDRCHR